MHERNSENGGARAGTSERDVSTPPCVSAATPCCWRICLAMNSSPFSISFGMWARLAVVSLSAAVMRALLYSLWGKVPVLCPCTMMSWHCLQFLVKPRVSRSSCWI